LRAVVFDFFGTLTDPAVEALRRKAFGATAAALGVCGERFWAVMSGSFPERVTGVHGGTRETLRTMARRLGVEPTAEQLDAAVAAQHAGAARVRHPGRGVLDLLGLLRARGFRLAVLSDCSSELCEAWAATEYAGRVDATVFSWAEGYRKPDPRLYATAAARLGAPAAACWYVGDGASREHQGALAAGMRPVLVTNSRHPGAAALRDDPDRTVPEYVIDEVTELATLVGSPGPP
jgi:putative hydrolase of the HAD superfamily